MNETDPLLSEGFKQAMRRMAATVNVANAASIRPACAASTQPPRSPVSTLVPPPAQARTSNAAATGITASPTMTGGLGMPVLSTLTSTSHAIASIPKRT